MANCTVSVNPGNVLMGAASVSTFTVTNNSDQVGNWVRIQSPGLSAYTIANMEASGWYPNGGGNEANFAGGYLESGASANFSLSLAETGEEISNMSWEALISYDGGENFTSCGEVNILVERAETPQINNATITVGNNSAVLTWNTSVTASGSVSYGTSESYGSSVSSGTGVTHVVTLSNLSPSTTYNYQIQATSDGGTTSTTNNTFVTSAADVVTTVTNTVTNVVTNTVTSTVTNTNTVTKTITDLVAPVLAIKDLNKKVWSSAPLISGTASDNRGVSWVEHRRKNIGAWSSVVVEGKAGEKKVSWEVLPEISVDGTYVLEFRAVDVFGNKSKIQTVDVVIDQIPPTVGGMAVYQNGMRMPSEQGVVYVASDIKGELNFYERGGSDRIAVKIGKEVIVAAKIPGSNSWMARFNLSAGRYETEFEAVDGAGRVSINKGVVIVAMDNSQILVGEAGAQAILKTYFWDSEEKRYRVWSAETYGQSSELVTDKSGQFSLILPKGEYYLEMKVGKFRVLTPTFKVERTEPISLTAKVTRLSWWNRLVPVAAKVERKKVMLSEPVAKINLSDMGVVGKPKIVLLLTPEMKETEEALSKYYDLASGANRDLLVIGVQVDEPGIAAVIGQRKIDYKMDLMAEWLPRTGSLVLPRALFVDDFGNIEKTEETLY